VWLGLRRLASIWVLAGALGALVFLAAGCGGNGQHSTKAEPTPAHLQRGRVTEAGYKRHLYRINLQQTAAVNKIRKAVQKVKTVKQLKGVLLAYANEQERIGSQVGYIYPPKRVAKANSLLAQGFRDEAVQLRAMLPRLSKFKNPRLALLMIEHNQPKGARELDQAVSQLKKLGINPKASKTTGGEPPSQHY
jgi:hypothetical protein